MDPQHPDYAQLAKIRDEIFRRIGDEAILAKAFPTLVRDAIDFVLDPVHTARTRIVELDKVEKTFIGLKVEHFFRDKLDIPKGVRDLRIVDEDVDIKHTVSKSWTIPPETYRVEGPCVLIMTAEDRGFCRLGLICARDAYLRPGRNRDAKRGISATGQANILWLLPKAPFPVSRWDGLDMEAFRALRKVTGGAERAARFFEANVNRPTHRSVIQALLYDQDDYMKRLRGNGGARDKLRGLVLLSGSRREDVKLAREQGIELASDEMVACLPRSETNTR
jgi:hypothetical protein